MVNVSLITLVAVTNCFGWFAEIVRALSGAQRRTLSALDSDQVQTFSRLLQLITESVAFQEGSHDCRHSADGLTQVSCDSRVST